MRRAEAHKLIEDAILDYADLTPDKYKLDDTFESMGIDSLGVVQVMINIEEQLNIDHIDGADKMMSQRSTVKDAIDLVEKVTTTVQ